MFGSTSLVKTQLVSVTVLVFCIILNRIFQYYEELDEYDGSNLHQQYDYIIVGGGTSGSVLASRLSENENATILLIEAGDTPEKNPFIDTPIFTDRVKDGPYDWSYKTIPQKYSCKGHIDKAAKWHFGKGLGGSSNLNYMEYLRGSRHDYDSWIPGQAAHQWSYKEVLPYFIKSEDQRNKEFIKTVFHGFGGVLSVIDVYTSTLTKLLQNSFEEFGLKKKDLNGKNQFGWSPIQATIYNGIRWSTYRAFLRRAVFRENLHVVTMATAHKITFDGPRATAVTFKRRNETVTITSRKEILLTSGTIGSAKLLLLSGIGPKEHLEKLKIPLVTNLPVGENLRDQVVGDGIEFYTPHDEVAMSVVKADDMLSSLGYSIFGSGMRATPRFREVVANIRTKRHPNDIKHPLLSLRFVASTEVYTAHQVHVDPKVWNEIHSLMNIDTKEGFTVFPVLLHPKSIGTLSLKSTNPDDDPLIDPNYLSNEGDVKLLADAYRFIRKLKNTKTFKDHSVAVNNRLISACSHLGNYSNEAYLHCHLRYITLPGLSPTGTCKMGTFGDPSAVVDEDLRVHGLQGLRVVDASVVPSTLTGNSYTTQIMIAERAADIILNKNSVKAIKDYFHHLITMKHKKISEED